MDEQNNNPQVPVHHRRKPRSKLQIFKESYLPVLIAGLALILIFVFVIGAVSRSLSGHKAEKAASIATAESLANEAKRLNAESRKLLNEAELLASGYDYEGAIATLEKFSGKMTDFPVMQKQRSLYKQALSEMVVYDNLSKIPNLSFQLLIADPVRAFADEEYGSAYQRNFVTIREFEKILKQLYDNGYVLVSLHDLVEVTKDPATGKTIYNAKPLYLPEGKKPVMLTETSVNYYSYMIDSDNDGTADKDGAGFASCLTLDANGKLTTEYVDANGSKLYGAYDLIPILDAFLAEHPDFSLRGARATIAVSGYDGLFGYRTNASAKESSGNEAYAENVRKATDIAAALRQSGYEIACYSYDNMSYDSCGVPEIQADMNRWKTEVTPILGTVNTLVFAQNSDIADKGSYSGDKYELLHTAGFDFFIGASENGSPWGNITSDYVRQHRILVNGSNLAENPGIYKGLFDAASVQDPARKPN